MLVVNSTNLDFMEEWQAIVINHKKYWKFNIRASLSQQKLDIISDMMEENTRFLLNEWNFIQVSVSSHFSFTFEFRIACVNICDLFLPKDYVDVPCCSLRRKQSPSIQTFLSCLQVDDSRLSDLQALLRLFQVAERSLLHPLVIICVSWYMHTFLTCWNQWYHFLGQYWAPFTFPFSCLSLTGVSNTPSLSGSQKAAVNN